jgi:hypothetical protein
MKHVSRLLNWFNNSVIDWLVVGCLTFSGREQVLQYLKTIYKIKGTYDFDPLLKNMILQISSYKILKLLDYSDLFTVSDIC